MASREAETKRGPRVGDAASLWNFTPSPGWTKDEAQILKLCLMKYGVGRWVQILHTGLLPGKLIQQLNGQTQRLIGQQSLAAYTGLQVDIDRIRVENADRTDVERKSGLIIWSGPNPNKVMRDEWRKEAQAKFGLTKEALKDVDELLEGVTKKVHRLTLSSQALAAATPPASLLDSDITKLDRGQKLALLRRLRATMQRLQGQLQQAEADQAAQDDESKHIVQPPQPTAATPDEDGVEDALPVRMLVSRRSRSASMPSGSKQASSLQPKSSNKTSKPAAKRKQSGPTIGSGAKRRSISRFANAALADDADLAFAAEHADGADLASEAAAAVSNGVDISQLEAMGFSKSKAKEALQETDNNLDAAIEWLVANCI